MDRLKKGRSKKSLWSLVFSIVVLSIIIFLLYCFYRSWEQRAWTKQASFVVAFALSTNQDSDQLLLVSFQPQEKGLAAFLLPENLLLETAGNKGDYRAGSLFRLDQLGKSNGRLLKKTLADNLGTIVDGFGRITVEDNFTLNELSEFNLKTRLTSFLTSLLLRGQGETDLNRWDQLRLLKAVLFAKEGRVKVINLAQSQAILTENLLDGSKVLRLDLARTDRLVREYFIDEAFGQENLEVAVFNATWQNGLAQKRARVLSNLGIRVVKVDQYQGNEETTQGECLLLATGDFVDSYTLFRLQQAWECQVKDQDTAWARAGLVLIIGGD